MKSAGPRKITAIRYRPSRPGSAAGGGAATTGGSAVTPPALKSLLPLLVRGCRGGLELLGDPGRVARRLQEVLEDAPLALARGRSERRRLLVRHVEDDGLGRP